MIEVTDEEIIIERDRKPEKDQPDRELVEITIKVSQRFVDIMDRSIEQLEKTYECKIERGEYLEQAMSDLVEAVVEMEKKGLAYQPDDDNPMHG